MGFRSNGRDTLLINVLKRIIIIRRYTHYMSQVDWNLTRRSSKKSCPRFRTSLIRCRAHKSRIIIRTMMICTCALLLFKRLNRRRRSELSLSVYILIYSCIYIYIYRSTQARTRYFFLKLFFTNVNDRAKNMVSPNATTFSSSVM